MNEAQTKKYGKMLDEYLKAWKDVDRSNELATESILCAISSDDLAILEVALDRLLGQSCQLGEI